jgi:hypothetical protein
MDSSFQSGVVVPTLFGTDNYVGWVRGLFKASQKANLHEIITGKIVLGAKPVFPVAPQRAVPQDGLKSKETFEKIQNDYRSAVFYYSHQFEAWVTLRNRFIKANALLLNTISHDIFVGDFNSPAELLHIIARKYMPHNAGLLQNIEDCFETLRLADKGMAAYLLQAETLRLEFADATGRDYRNFVDKLFCGLPEQYSAFEERFRLKHDVCEYPAGKLDLLFDQLEAEELRIERREAARMKLQTAAKDKAGFDCMSNWSGVLMTGSGQCQG